VTQGTIRLADAPVQEAEKPVLYASLQDLGILTDAAWDAMYQANNPPRYFRHGCVPVRIEEDDNGVPVIRQLTQDRLKYEIARVATWKAIRKSKDGTESEVDAKPPGDVIRDMLATPDPLLPVLNRIVEAPVCAPDGSIATAPGYLPRGRFGTRPRRAWQSPTYRMNLRPTMYAKPCAG